MTKRSQPLPETLVQVTSLREFFRDSVDSAMSANNVSMDHQTSHYVVNLLTLFARSEALYESTPEGLQLRPLAQMLSDSLEASTLQQRTFGLQRLGDVALFISGFFAESLQRSAVDIDYYINMGGGAYRSLSLHVRGTMRGEAFGNVFAELAEKFQPIVDVLNEVREAAHSTSDADILRLYEIWLKTGSQRASRLLRKLGVHPEQSGRTAYQH